MNSESPRPSCVLKFALAFAVLLPALAVGSPAAPLTTNTPAPDQILAQLRNRLAEAQSELGSLLAAQAGATNSFPDATPSEIIEYQLALQASLRAYQRQLDDIASLEALDQRQRDLAETISSWTGFAEPPPYSILLIDNLRDAVHSLTASIETARTSRDIFEQLGVEARDVLSQSDRRLRLLNEEIEAATEPAKTARLTWQRTLESARNRLAAANSAVFERRRQKAAAELVEYRHRLEFARRRLIAASREVRFSQADFDRVLANLDANRRQLESENQAAERASQTAQAALQTAREELRQALAEPPKPATNNASTAARVSVLQQRVGARTVQAETAMHRLNLSRQLIDLSVYERAMWQTRHTTFGAADAATLQQGYRRLVTLQRILQTAKPYFLHQLDLAARQIAEEQESLQNRLEAQRDPALAREQLDSFAERETLFRGALRNLEKNERLLLRWRESLDQARLALPLTGRIRDLFSEFSTFSQKLWNFELLVAEDTITVDGQPVTGRRSVTIGKIAKAILILVIGFWLASLFARLLERVAAGRFGIEPNQANLVRRWTRVVLVLLLVLVSLVWVKIPFTVFAFLGGALAIAFGFGMQTLLKNFISGIIILFERPFRVGDVLETGGQCGTVTSIGIRSSILQLGDGTEALIPNSTLLEQSLTNWTYSNRTVRSSLTVVVASDSDTREVARLLTEAVDRHGLVLKEPKPSVLFKDFGDNGFVFDLRYWLDVRKHSSSQVASDLRYMIAAAFTEHGIDLSFPQRELHFDAKRQLRIEVVSSSVPAIVLLSGLLFGSGCSSLGPRTVGRDRLDYSRSISDSWKRQTLLNIVKLRYFDLPTQVDVGQIVAGYSLETDASIGGTLSGGSDSLSLGAGGHYTDRPTITYTPLTGARFVRSSLMPLQPEGVFFTVQAGWPADGVLFAAVASLNGLKNQEGTMGGVTPPDPAFLRVLELLRKIQQTGAVALRIHQDAQKQQTTILAFRSKDASAETVAEITELRRLLRLDPEAQEFKMVFAATPANDHEVAVLTRSLVQIMGMMAAFVEVPAKDIAEGRATPGLVGGAPLHIRCSEHRPAEAFAAVPYRDRWFWIDDRDLKTKRAFALLMMFHTLSDTGEREPLPLITIPAQ